MKSITSPAYEAYKVKYLTFIKLYQSHLQRPHGAPQGLLNPLYRYLAVDLLCLQVFSHLLEASGDAVEGVKGLRVRRTQQPVAPWQHQANASGKDEQHHPHGHHVKEQSAALQGVLPQ